MIPPDMPMEEGFYRTTEYIKAPADMERTGQEVDRNPLSGFSALEGHQTVEIDRPSASLNPGDDIWLRVKARVKGSQSAGGGKVALELSNFKVEETPED